MTDLFHGPVVVCDFITLKNFATRPGSLPHLPGLRLRHLQPNKEPKHLGWNGHGCTRQSTASLPFRRAMYRCQSHHTPHCDARLASNTILTFFSPLYMLKVWSEYSIVVTYIGLVCLMKCMCVSEKCYEGRDGGKSICVNHGDTHRLRSLPLNYALRKREVEN